MSNYNVKYKLQKNKKYKERLVDESFFIYLFIHL